ncbi:MAG TPA: cupin domain-containing protein [Gaiellaceae bacterium]|nr:cupin domain-containing protein [Gaiellaceae bacterium]
MILALSHARHGGRLAVTHELEDGRALVFELLDEPPPGALAAARVELDPERAWLARLDRVDFPPGGVAYRHVHPGPGIRYLASGELTLEREGGARAYRAGEAWFEDADDPVTATAGPEGAAFLRLLLLPAEWAGKRTIRYLDPADEAKPKLQRATILREEPLRL